MKRYDKYKPSGIDWIGDIPEHWTVATVGRVTNLGRGRVISNLEIGENPGEYPVYSSQTENNGEMGHLATYDFDGEYVTWTTDGANAGTVFHRSGKFNCTNVCGTMQPKNWEQLDLRFLPYFLNLGTKYSVRLDINPKLMNNMMAKIPIVLPSIEEQNSISDFLATKIASINSFIQNKKKLVDLLQEERLSMIAKAVTGNGKNWKTKKLRYVAKKVQTGSTPPSNEEKYYSDEIKWYTPSDFSTNLKLVDSKRKLSELAIADGVVKLFPSNSVLFVGIGATLGKVGYITEPATSNQQINCISFDSLPKAIFYANYFFVNQPNITALSNSATLPILNQSQMKDISLPVPNNEEEITNCVEYINSENSRINSMIEKIQREISLIDEYRLSLIYETVTGKIKVI